MKNIYDPIYCLCIFFPKVELKIKSHHKFCLVNISKYRQSSCQIALKINKNKNNKKFKHYI